MTEKEIRKVRSGYFDYQDLNEHEKDSLKDMASHPGFPILQELVEGYIHTKHFKDLQQAQDFENVRRIQGEINGSRWVIDQLMKDKDGKKIK